MTDAPRSRAEVTATSFSFFSEKETPRGFRLCPPVTNSKSSSTRSASSRISRAKAF
jgi:hypothetical protein